MRRADARFFVEWEREFKKRKDKFFTDKFNPDNESSSKRCDESYNDMVRAFQALGTFLRCLSNHAMQAFRDGAEEYVMPDDVRELKELASANAEGKGAAALISRYLATKGQHKRTEDL